MQQLALTKVKAVYSGGRVTSEYTRTGQADVIIKTWVGLNGQVAGEREEMMGCQDPDLDEDGFKEEEVDSSIQVHADNVGTDQGEHAGLQGQSRAPDKEYPGLVVGNGSVQAELYRGGSSEEFGQALPGLDSLQLEGGGGDDGQEVMDSQVPRKTNTMFGVVI